MLYKSSFSDFMDQFLATHPDVKFSRVTLRQTWWRCPLSDEELKSFEASSIPQKPYVYE